MGTARDVVAAFYQVTLEEPDVDEFEKFVAPNVHFVGPLQSSEGSDAYFEINRQLLPFHVETRMHAQFESGDQVCSIYDMDVRTPAGDIVTLKMADWMTVTDDKISAQTIYYDPREFAKAFGI